MARTWVTAGSTSRSAVAVDAAFERAAISTDRGIFVVDLATGAVATV